MKKGREVGKEGEEKKGRREQILITGQIQEETNKGVPYNYNHTDLCDYMIIVFFQKKESKRVSWEQDRYVLLKINCI